MKLLCFDIETTGLDAARDEVTMICTQDVETQLWCSQPQRRASTSMDVDVDSVEAEVNAYTTVQQVPLDKDPLT